MPALHVPALLALLAERAWTRDTLAEKARISPGTVTNAVRGKNLSAPTVNCIAEALGVELHRLLPNSTPSVLPGGFRDVCGRWAGTAEDLVVPGIVEYAIAPISYTYEMTIKDQAGDRVRVEGRIIGMKKIEQPFAGNGWLREGGNYLVLDWWNPDPQVQDYGIALLEYTADGERLAGLYLGRERIHTDRLIFGRINARRVSATDPK